MRFHEFSKQVSTRFISFPFPVKTRTSYTNSKVVKLLQSLKCDHSISRIFKSDFWQVFANWNHCATPPPAAPRSRQPKLLKRLASNLAHAYLLSVLQFLLRAHICCVERPSRGMYKSSLISIPLFTNYLIEGTWLHNCSYLVSWLALKNPEVSNLKLTTFLHHTKGN
jgi:hypothetical protein